jgi:hypothetical protein
MTVDTTTPTENLPEYAIEHRNHPRARQLSPFEIYTLTEMLATPSRRTELWQEGFRLLDRLIWFAGGANTVFLVEWLAIEWRHDFGPFRGTEILLYVVFCLSLVVSGVLSLFLGLLRLTFVTRQLLRGLGVWTKELVYGLLDVGCAILLWLILYNYHRPPLELTYQIWKVWSP